MNNDINVVVMDFNDVKPREMVTKNQDDSYTIFINARLSSTAQLDAYNHAIKHILNNDFENQDVQRIESIAHATNSVADVESVESFRTRLLDDIRRSRRRIRHEMRKMDERREWLERNVPGYAERNRLF